jgi:hypothetical protein
MVELCFHSPTYVFMMCFLIDQEQEQIYIYLSIHNGIFWIPPRGRAAKRINVSEDFSASFFRIKVTENRMDVLVRV